MKKSFPFLIFVLAMVSCAQDAQILVTDESEPKIGIRTPREAIDIATKILTEGSIGTRSEALTVQEVTVISGVSSRSNSDTLIYAVNFSDEKGYALISASYASKPVIGFVEEGSYVEEKALKNPSYNFFLGAAKEYVAGTMAPNAVGVIDSVYFNLDLLTPETKSIKPLNLVEWGNRYPEGMFCPNKVAGCVQVNMMQIMSWIKSPDGLALTYPGRDKDYQDINWSTLNRHKKSFESWEEYKITEHNLFCKASEETHTTLARVARELGYRNSYIRYDGDVTWANTASGYEILRKLAPEHNYSEQISYKSGGVVYNTLENPDRAILWMSGYATGVGGHVWLCEGAQVDIYKVPYFEGTTPASKEVKVYYYYYNWGWGGSDNGYFLEDVFDNDKPSSRIDMSSNVYYYRISKNIII